MGSVTFLSDPHCFWFSPAIPIYLESGPTCFPAVYCSLKIGCKCFPSACRFTSGLMKSFDWCGSSVSETEATTPRIFSHRWSSGWWLLLCSLSFKVPGSDLVNTNTTTLFLLSSGQQNSVKTDKSIGCSGFVLSIRKQWCVLPQLC